MVGSPLLELSVIAWETSTVFTPDVVSVPDSEKGELPVNVTLCAAADSLSPLVLLTVIEFTPLLAYAV